MTEDYEHELPASNQSTHEELIDERMAEMEMNKNTEQIEELIRDEEVNKSNLRDKVKQVIEDED
jgi:hypothetical protein